MRPWLFATVSLSFPTSFSFPRLAPKSLLLAITWVRGEHSRSCWLPRRLEVESELQLDTEGEKRDWDSVAQAVTKRVRRATRREQKCERHQLRRVLVKGRKAGVTRTEALEDEHRQHSKTMAACLGRYLDEAPSDHRHFYKRIADWTADQTITRLVPSPGRRFQATWTRAEEMGSEWTVIQGQEHVHVTHDRQAQLLDELVTFPADKQISADWNKWIVARITAEEVRQAIKSMSRHKAGGLDSLPNVFYKDFEELMLDHLVVLSNELLEGAPVPPYFAKALIIPLRKKGNSTDAMDYRPIALLQSSYNIFTKVMAQRIQHSLHTIIGQRQQGFMHDRQMERSLVLMLAVLSSATSQQTSDIDGSEGVVLLDLNMHTTCSTAGSRSRPAAPRYPNSRLPGREAHAFGVCRLLCRIYTERRPVAAPAAAPRPVQHDLGARDPAEEMRLYSTQHDSVSKVI